MSEEEVQEVRDTVAASLEKTYVGDLPGPESGKHWVRFALNRQASAVRKGLHG